MFSSWIWLIEYVPASGTQKASGISTDFSGKGIPFITYSFSAEKLYSCGLVPSETLSQHQIYYHNPWSLFHCTRLPFHLLNFGYQV
jgi:hypothetical protein